MVYLPPEIWKKIASYLKQSDQSLWNYRYLNSTFYNLALDDKYGTLSLDLNDPYHVKGWGFLGSWSSTKHIAARVRSLEVKFSKDNPLSKPRGPHVPIEGFKKMFFGPHPQKWMIKTLEGLVNVSSFTLNALEYQLPENSMLIFNTTSRTCANSLTSLELWICDTHVEHLLHRKLPFPQLTSLFISVFSSRFENAPPPKYASTITTFVNRYVLTLTTLSLLVKPVTDDISIFCGLDHIPHLKKVYVLVSASSDHGSIGTFVENHATTLQKLELLLEDCDFRPLSKIFDNVKNPCPRLRFIIIRAESSPGFEDALPEFFDLGVEPVDFIRRCSSLVALDTIDMYMRPETFFSLFDHRGRLESSYASLRDLRIKLVVFTIEMLDLLVDRLPDLQAMMIHTDKLKVQHNAPDEVDDLSQFCQVAIKRNYSRWKLRHLILFHSRNGQPPVAAAAAAIAIAAASLQYINNQRRNNFLSKEEFCHLIS